MKNKTKTCPTCYGTGKITRTIQKQVTCTRCGGAGRVTCTTCGGSGYIGQNIRCPGCGGFGKTNCTTCGGRGHTTRTETIQETCKTCNGQGRI